MRQVGTTSDARGVLALGGSDDAIFKCYAEAPGARVAREVVLRFGGGSPHGVRGENRSILCAGVPRQGLIVQVTDSTAHQAVDARGGFGFPFFVYDDGGSHRRENITERALDTFLAHYDEPAISKWSVFDYVYAMLHHAGYRATVRGNLKRELPRIPLAPDFRAFQRAGQQLIELHLNYEKLDPWPLEFIEKPGVPLSYRVEKMKLTKDRAAVIVNESLTMSGITPEVYEYRLGNRSALEWVIDQYRVSTDKRSGITSDPNRPDDEQYIVRLVGQVVRVSVETVKIVSALPAAFTDGTPDDAPVAGREPSQGRSEPSAERRRAKSRARR